MDHLETYEKICKDKFDEILSTLKSLEKRLFIDNGEDCIQSKLNRCVHWVKIWGWLAVTIGGILSSVAAAIIIHKLVT